MKKIVIVMLAFITFHALASNPILHCPDTDLFPSDQITIVPDGYPQDGYYIKAVTPYGQLFTSIVYTTKPELPKQLVSVRAVGESINCTYKTTIDGKAVYLSNFGDMGGHIKWVSSDVHGNICHASADTAYCQYQVTKV